MPTKLAKKINDPKVSNNNDSVSHGRDKKKQHLTLFIYFLAMRIVGTELDNQLKPLYKRNTVTIE